MASAVVRIARESDTAVRVDSTVLTMKLAALAPRDAVLVSESGLNDGADLRRLKEHGFHGFLIGESLMRAPNPEIALRDLRNDAR